MRTPASLRFVEKAEAAFVAAIEVYNKPSFQYRSESFAILAVNAWELLLKAKVLANNKNNLSSIHEYERRQTASGALSQRRFLRRNRAGNPLSISLAKAIDTLKSHPGSKLDPAVEANIIALVEIRDNAVHSIHTSAAFARQVLEVGTASVCNFVYQVKTWFKRDLSSSLNLLLPVGFLASNQAGTMVQLSPDEKRVVEYVAGLQANAISAKPDELHVSVSLDISLKKNPVATAASVQITRDPTATKVFVTEEQMSSAFPWSHEELVRRMEARYQDFKRNSRFFELMAKHVKKNESLARTRYLDPNNKQGLTKVFYSPNALSVVFDQHYKRK